MSNPTGTSGKGKSDREIGGGKFRNQGHRASARRISKAIGQYTMVNKLPFWLCFHSGTSGHLAVGSGTMLAWIAHRAVCIDERDGNSVFSRSQGVLSFG